MSGELTGGGLVIQVECDKARYCLSIWSDGFPLPIRMQAGYVNLLAVASGLRYHLANDEAECVVERVAGDVVFHFRAKGRAAMVARFPMDAYRQALEAAQTSRPYLA